VASGRPTSRPSALCPRARQPRSQDPHQLRGGRRAHLRSSAREVVLHCRVRQAEAVGGGLPRAGRDDGGDHSELLVRGGARRSSPGPSAVPHANRRAAASHSSRPSIGIPSVANAGPRPVGRASTNLGGQRKRRRVGGKDPPIARDEGDADSLVILSEARRPSPNLAHIASGAVWPDLSAIVRHLLRSIRSASVSERGFMGDRTRASDTGRGHGQPCCPSCRDRRSTDSRNVIAPC
jgi:hypothetical protein